MYNGSKSTGDNMFKNKRITMISVILILSFNSQANDEQYKSALAYDNVVEYINSNKVKYSRNELIDFFAKTKIKQSIIKSSNNQPEKKLTWGMYKNKVVTRQKIEKGILFVQDNIDSLNKAESKYGVPKEIIASIIGIESFYGKYKGNNNAIDAISTMAFQGSKRRQSFFTKELTSFFNNCYDNELNPMEQKSSWAGAFGYPQFISSSIRAYGIDFNDDGIIDLNNSVDDSIGSVANYLNKSG